MSSTPQGPQVPPDMRAFNKQLIEQFRANHGKLTTGPFAGREPMLLTTTGARSGQPRTVVVGFRRDGERYLVIASDNGNDRTPDWYRNLLADPVATVELGPETFQVRSRDAVVDERPRFAELIDYFGRQQALTSREIPIVVLERV
jgi:deazaflavin-dependent oxidoreductase (nitroreductase family)